MRERGALLAGGPFDDQEDETFRGLGIYGTGLEETRQLVALDPSMQAGPDARRDRDLADAAWRARLPGANARPRRPLG